MLCLLGYLCMGCSRGTEANVTNGYEDEPVCGGITDLTDHDAPKEIQSDEINDYYARFYSSWRWMGEDDHFFEFSVKHDENGQLTVYENYSGNHVPADEELLSSLQAVIRKYKLTSWNGYYKTTAGLPPEFQPCNLNVNYVSGEHLRFTMDNDPDAEWVEDTYTIMADWFAAHGNDALRPTRPASVVTRLNFDYQDPETDYSFHTGMPDSEEYGKLPPDLLKNVTAVFDKYDVLIKYDFSIYNHDSGRIDNHEEGFYGFGGDHPDHSEQNLPDTHLDIYAEFDDGDRINIMTSKASELEQMRPMIEELMDVCGR